MSQVLLPIFAVILLGYGLHRWSFPGEAFWPLADRFNYYLCFPALLFLRIAVTDFATLPVTGMVLACAGAVVPIAAGLLLSPLSRFEAPAFTSIFQGSIRPNTYIGLAVAAALFGPDGLALLAVAIAAVIPLVNLLSVSVMMRRLARGRRSFWQLLTGILRNPLILACLLGIALNALALPLPLPIQRPLEVLGQAALPLGLLTVGAGLQLRGLCRALDALALAAGLKLLLLPLVTLLIGLALGVQGTALAIAVLFNAMPASVSSYALAGQLGGDTRLMAAIITSQTLLAMGSLPLLLLLLD